MTVIRQYSAVTLIVVATISIDSGCVWAQEASQKPDIIQPNAARCQQNTTKQIVGLERRLRVWRHH